MFYHAVGMENYYTVLILSDSIGWKFTSLYIVLVMNHH